MNVKLSDHCGLHLTELAAADPRIWVLDGDLADSDGAEHFARVFPDRFIMTGIAEQSMVSIAAGLASCGLRPFVFSFSAFLCYRAYDQIRVCLSQSKQPVTIVGSNSGGCAGRNGKTHAALNDIALIASLPNFTIWSPADSGEVKLALDEILGSANPAYIRLPRIPLDELSENAPSFEGKPDEFSETVIVSTGLTSHIAFEVKNILSEKETMLHVVHLSQIHPLPEGILAQAFSKARNIFVLEDHYTFGGLSSLIRHTFPDVGLNAIGWRNEWSGKSGSESDILRYNELTASQIADKILAKLN